MDGPSYELDLKCMPNSSRTDKNFGLKCIIIVDSQARFEYVVYKQHAQNVDLTAVLICDL